MLNIEDLLEDVSLKVLKQQREELYFLVLEMKFAYSKLDLASEAFLQCYFKIVGRNGTGTHINDKGTHRFITGFYGLVYMPAQVQKALGQTLNNAPNTICFLRDILFVSKGTKKEQQPLIVRVMNSLNDKNLALIITKCVCY